MLTRIAHFLQPDVIPAALIRILCATTLFWLIPTLATRLVARRSSAALRHRIWSISTAAVLGLPVLILLLPQWRVVYASRTGRSPVATITAERTEEPTQSVAAPMAPVAGAASKLPPLPPFESRRQAADFDIPWTACAAITWLVVCAWLVVRQQVAIVWAARMRRRATLIPNSDRAAEKLRLLSSNSNRRSTPPLRSSAEIASPICVGLVRSCILLPADYQTWPAAQLDAALAHELAHANRRDVLWQAAAQLAAAVYWFHPLAWLAMRQMHVERELACDDAVLRSGQESAQYARVLVQMAEVIAALPRSATLAGVAMASRHRLEQRVRAVLEPTRPRNAVSRFSMIALSTTGLAILVVAAILQPVTAAEPPPVAAAPPPATLTPDVEKLLNDLATQESALHNLKLRAESWDEFSANEGGNDWQKDKPHSLVQAWYRGSPMQQERIDVHDEVLTWIQGAAPFSEQSYSVAFNGKTGKYIQFCTGAIGQVNPLRRATISTDVPAVMLSANNETGGSFSIYYYGRRGQGISSIFRGYFATIRAHNPAIPIVVTTEKYQGANTLKLTIGTPAPARGTEEYWFDTARGLSLLAVRNIAHDRAGLESISLEVHVTKLTEVAPKVWFPMEVYRYFNWYPDPADSIMGKSRAPDGIRRRSHFVASECVANDPNFDASIFSPEIPEGFSVNDQIARSSYPAMKPNKADPALEQMLRDTTGSH